MFGSKQTCSFWSILAEKLSKSPKTHPVAVAPSLVAWQLSRTGAVDLQQAVSSDLQNPQPQSRHNLPSSDIIHMVFSGQARHQFEVHSQFAVKN
jgi:hypothetical protein